MCLRSSCLSFLRLACVSLALCTHTIMTILTESPFSSQTSSDFTLPFCPCFLACVVFSPCVHLHLRTHLLLQSLSPFLALLLKEHNKPLDSGPSLLCIPQRFPLIWSESLTTKAASASHRRSVTNLVSIHLFKSNRTLTETYTFLCIFVLVPVGVKFICVLV